MLKHCSKCGKDKDETLFKGWRNRPIISVGVCKQCRLSEINRKKELSGKGYTFKTNPQKPLDVKINYKIGYAEVKHIRGIWRGMHDRCENKNNNNYSNYGGRGISVCKEWSDFERFANDMGRRPTYEHSIDRIDVNGNYEPSNCRWATQKEQMNNTRLSLILTLYRLSTKTEIPIHIMERLYADGLLNEYVIGLYNGKNPHFSESVIEYITANNLKNKYKKEKKIKYSKTYLKQKNREDKINSIVSMKPKDYWSNFINSRKSA